MRLLEVDYQKGRDMCDASESRLRYLRVLYQIMPNGGERLRFALLQCVSVYGSTCGPETLRLELQILRAWVADLF